MIPTQRILLPTQPSAAQLASGRYPKRKVPWKGLTLRIENEARTYRRGRGPEGEWETLMHFAYGEVERTEGVDGDPVDVFLGPYMDTAPMVYVVHQRKVRDWDKYDEDKCMLGFESEADATAAFLSSYSDPRFLGPITAMPVEEFIAKVKATRDAPAMIKAHVHAYTKKDGTFVAAHEDRRTAGRPHEPAPANLFDVPGVREMADKADADLVGAGGKAIEKFIGHVPDAKNLGATFGVMDAWALEDAYGPNPSPKGIEARAEITAAFAPVREALRRRFGDTVQLWRVQGKVRAPSANTTNMSAAPDGSRSVLSWSSDQEFARAWAGVRKPKKVYSEDEIRAFEATFERDGKVKIGSNWLGWDTTTVRKFDTDELVTVSYIAIFDGPIENEDVVTDTDSVRDYVESENGWRREENAANDARAARIVSADVPLNEVVWISDRAGQSEFIVRNRPGGVFVDPDGKLKAPLLLLQKAMIEGHRPPQPAAPIGEKDAPVLMLSKGLAEQMGLFDRVVPVKGSVDKEGHARRPHMAHRRVREEAPQNRLRERAETNGLDTLNDRESLEMLLSRVLPHAEAASGSHALVQRFGSYAQAVGAPMADVARVVGRDAALELKIVHDAAIRLTRHEVVQRPLISSWSALLSYVRTALAHEPREHFRVIYLDRKNQLLVDEVLGTGTVDHAPVYPREVVRRALELGASAMILLHNHPSGDPAPSSADVDMTKQIVDAAKVFKIAVHDHLVVGRDGVASLKALGMM